MNSSLLYKLLLTATFVLCHIQAWSNGRIDSLMNELDKVIDNRDRYLSIKESRLQHMHDRLDSVTDDKFRFEILSELFNEYLPFNADSAYRITVELETIAHRLGDSAKVVNAIYNRANIHTTTGMYNEALALIGSINTDRIPDYLRPYHYHTKRTIYGLLADFATFEPERERYKDLTDRYRDSLLLVNNPGTLPYALISADKFNVDGYPEKGISILREYMDSHNLTDHERAICAWTLSESYGLTGDHENQKEQLIISSISDLMSSVREYVSLRQLALLLYEEGDLDHAYRLMSIAIDDAAKCNARLRIIELNRFYPAINEIYIETVRSQQRALVHTIIIITFLSLILVILLVYMRKQMKRIARARHDIEEAYEKLNDLNHQLRAYNVKLQEANNTIAENSELKEVYIGRYMDQCMDYIEKLDHYRKSMGKLINTGKIAELTRLVKSSDLIDDELKQFYEQFDHTFLSLFPDFVQDFNRLLMPHEAIVPKREGSLNTELRIFALIRLGIQDSDKIAKFLRYSLTTIYNYRTKVRNKAVGDRNKLEQQVMKIGRAKQ